MDVSRATDTTYTDGGLTVRVHGLTVSIHGQGWGMGLYIGSDEARQLALLLTQALLAEGILEGHIVPGASVEVHP